MICDTPHVEKRSLNRSERLRYDLVVRRFHVVLNHRPVPPMQICTGDTKFFD